ncbi:Pentalenene synthase [Termitomyces sp. T112]|nr:Pentalenene synthase [Termitomyces sp. T112]
MKEQAKDLSRMESGLTESVFFLPDTLANWPWTRTISPFYLQAQADSSAWIQSFKIFTAGEQRAFDLCNFNLLASLGYPLENQDIIRAGTDLMGLFDVFDRYTDVAAPREAQEMADMVMDAIRNPDKARPAHECVVGEVARQFWKLSMQCASEGASRRFIKSFDEYTASVVQQAEDRAQNYIRSIDEYFLVGERQLV